MDQIISLDQDTCGRGGSETRPYQTRPYQTRPQPQPDASGMDAGGIGAGLVVPGFRAGTGQLYLLIAPHPAVDRLMDALAVRLALAADAALSEGVLSVRTSSARTSSARTSSAIEACQSRSAPGPYLHILDSGNRFDLHGIARGIARGISASSGSRGGSASITHECPDWTRPAPTVEAILQRIRVARAFTCYQAEALLAGVVGAHSVRRRGGSACAKTACFDQPRPAPTADAKTAHPDQPGPAPTADAKPARPDPPRSAPTADSSAPILVSSLLTPFADENVPRSERLRLLGRCIQHLKRLAGGVPVLVSAASPAGLEPNSMEAAEFLARLEAAADQVWRFESVVVGAGRPSTAELVRTLRMRTAPTGQLRMF